MPLKKIGRGTVLLIYKGREMEKLHSKTRNKIDHVKYALVYH
jgi:hypothetical protein